MSNRRKPTRRARPPRRVPQLYPTLPPKASQVLHYAGDVTEHALWRVMGPNTMGEYLTCVEAHYDPETNRTTLGMAYGAHQRPQAPATAGNGPLADALDLRDALEAVQALSAPAEP